MSEEMKTYRLTDRRPIRVVAKDWPLLAAAVNRLDPAGLPSEGMNRIAVYAHEDRRIIVIAMCEPANTDLQLFGGIYLDNPSTTDVELIAAVKQAWADTTLANPLLQECFADLPPEVIT